MTSIAKLSRRWVRPGGEYSTSSTNIWMLRSIPTAGWMAMFGSRTSTAFTRSAASTTIFCGTGDRNPSRGRTVSEMAVDRA